ncbi:MAG TPA: hypothetical protein PKD37_02570 [Oligoflexia bacterium]|nr:hypothetical protein [Oligoflexia bacterium]HMP26855.1 hypothetical protein [Oligoflexia bacterium]
MKPNKNTFVISLFLLSSCGPVFETKYTYIPPKSASGASCVANCSITQSQCEDMERMRYQTCEERAQMNYDSCVLSHRLTGEKEKWYDCWRDSCSMDLEKCAERYRICYQSCGGRVLGETVCTANCDKIEKPSGKVR